MHQTNTQRKRHLFSEFIGKSAGNLVFGAVDTISNQTLPPTKTNNVLLDVAGTSAELQSNSFKYGHQADSSPSSRSTATANASSASYQGVARWLVADGQYESISLDIYMIITILLFTYIITTITIIIITIKNNTNKNNNINNNNNNINNNNNNNNINNNNNNTNNYNIKNNDNNR